MSTPVTVVQLLDTLFDRGASDVLLSVGAPPTLRIDGGLVPLGQEHLTSTETETLVRDLLSPQQRLVFAEHNTVDFAFQWGDSGRIRGNAFRQRGSVAVALRAIPTHIPSYDELILPGVVGDLAYVPHGLVLLHRPDRVRQVDHPASMVDSINAEQAGHIITIEDPIEYVHTNKKSMSSSARSGVDTPLVRLRPCGARCVRTPTWCWSGRCATSKPSRSP